MLLDPPTAVFPELADWRTVGMHDAVFRAIDPRGALVYVREDDGSSELLERLARSSDIPAPRVLDRRAGWLVLGALPGLPLHDARWRARPGDAAQVISEALIHLERAKLTHGDMCVPNVLGDLGTGRLCGIVDWRDAGRFDREIDVASAVWSCGFNGYPPATAIEVLRKIGWPQDDEAEVDRLCAVWSELAGPADERTRPAP